MSDTLTEPAGGVEGGAVEPPEEAPGVAEPGPDTAAPAAVEEPAASPWAPSQEDWQALTGRLDQLSQAVNPPPAPATAPAFVQTDDTTGETVVDPAALEQYIQWQVDQRLGQYEPALQQTQAQQGEQVISERFAELQATVGTFDTALARNIAEGIAAKTGDPLKAIEQGARLAADHDKAVAARAVEEYKQTLRNVGQAPREPGAAGAASEHFQPRSGIDGYKDVADNWAARHSLAT